MKAKFKNSDLFKGNYKKFKLAALDIDGTLINSHHIITSRTKNAIKKAKDAGIKVTISTGRHYRSALSRAKEINIDAPLICSDGALIKDFSTNSAIYHSLSKEIAADIMKTASQYDDFKIQIFTEERKINIGSSYRSKYFKRFLREPLKHSPIGYFNLMRDFAFIPVTNVKNVDEAIKAMEEEPLKVVVYGNERQEDLKLFIEEITKKYKDEISITSAIDNCIDILRGGVSKAKGLAVVSEKLGLNREEIIAVGDNINDIKMIEYAGLGVAMGNAPERVKSKADYVTADNDSEGLAIFFEKLLAGEIHAKETLPQTKFCQSES
ncbi:MAG TPA: HAD family phosphatase [Tepidanaerobacter syntrophicus]|uniref:Cof-type HAD-IIB family hydrolase n=1 Tax=Tepidanaerobacter syntrophicus TaxID=224999 RepID=UPI00175C6468|nr:Cof-type HAD-IIB family hydrolase [Tepidanaerobacter syntrophicus]HHV82351.1 HAD family phosphatase [Tepidanaerobacter syntrophicus]